MLTAKRSATARAKPKAAPPNASTVGRVQPAPTPVPATAAAAARRTWTAVALSVLRVVRTRRASWTAIARPACALVRTAGRAIRTTPAPASPSTRPTSATAPSSRPASRRSSRHQSPLLCPPRSPPTSRPHGPRPSQRPSPLLARRPSRRSSRRQCPRLAHHPSRRWSSCAQSIGHWAFLRDWSVLRCKGAPSPRACLASSSASTPTPSAGCSAQMGTPAARQASRVLPKTPTNRATAKSTWGRGRGGGLGSRQTTA